MRMIEIEPGIGILEGIPFASGPTSRDVGVTNRAKHYIKFIDEASGPILDVGNWNYVSEMLERAFRIGLDSTLDSDFNDIVTAPQKRYNTIFCFEVIEHVMNPLQFMGQLRDLLYPNGVLYVSTPRLFLGIYHSPHHFTEYKPKKLEILFKYAGLVIEKSGLHCQFPVWWGLTGIRPAFRVLFHRNRVWKLRKLGLSISAPTKEEPLQFNPLEYE